MSQMLRLIGLITKRILMASACNNGRTRTLSACVAPKEEESRDDTSGNKWKKPGSGWIKLNVDGSYKKNIGAAIGGVVRDCEGLVVLAFHKFIEVDTSTQAELMSVDKGLSLLKEFGYDKVHIESDCSSVVEHIKKAMKTKVITREDEGLVNNVLRIYRTPYNIRDKGQEADLIEKDKGIWNAKEKFYTLRIKKILLEMQHTIKHVKRGENSVADALAEMAYANKSFKIYTRDDLKTFPDIDRLITQDSG